MIRYASQSIINQLLDKGLNIDSTDEEGNTLFHLLFGNYALYQMSFDGMLELLMSRG